MLKDSRESSKKTQLVEELKQEEKKRALDKTLELERSKLGEGSEYEEDEKELTAGEEEPLEGASMAPQAFGGIERAATEEAESQNEASVAPESP